MSPIKKRSKEIDAIRGIAIILVVIGHVIQYQNPASYENTLLFRIIYSFHMPLFFFVSGIVASYGHNVELNLKLLLKRTRALMYPWIVWTIFIFVLFYIRNSVAFAFTKAIGFYWFLPVLYICYCTSFLFCSAHKEGLRLDVTVLLIAIIWFLMFLANGFWISSVRFHGFFFATGFVFATYTGSISRISAKRLLLPVFLVISLILWYLAFNLTSSGNGLPNYWNFLIRILSALSGIVFVWGVVSILPEKIKYLLASLGVYSLQIYLVHLLFVQLIVFSPSQYSIALWSTILLSVPVLIGLILNRMGYSKYIFGR